jgi:hypothetical protein
MEFEEQTKQRKSQKCLADLIISRQLLLQFSPKHSIKWCKKTMWQQFQVLEEIRDKLHDMILGDGSIWDLDNKIRVIEMASPNANTGNANTPDNDVMMSMPALFLKRKSLVSRLP